MLVMQLRMIVEISRNMGYRPSWIFLLSCFCWIMVNSLFFALFDGTEFVEDALQEFLPLVAGGSFGKVLSAIPAAGKVASMILQGASSMAVVYTTGKILQLKLNGSKKRLSGKERVKYRMKGYWEAVKILGATFPSTMAKTPKKIVVKSMKKLTEKLTDLVSRSDEPETTPAP